MKKFAALFPGQGSQNVGMGSGFYQESKLAKELFAQADKALGFSLTKLCLEGPIETLTLTQNAQPAILAVSYLCFLESELQPSAAAGHSLGEYSALVAARAISFEDAIVLVHKRGCYMQEAVPQGAGKMVAVMGSSTEQIAQAIAEVPNEIVEVANYNCPGQTVVAGSANGIDLFSQKITAMSGKVIPLNVSAPFHCSLMKPAADKLALDLKATSISNPVFPVYSNVTAKAMSDATEVRELLLKQVTNSVRWTELVQNMTQEQSLKTTIEFGAGGVLTKLCKRIDSSLERMEIADPSTLATTRLALS